MFDADCSLSLFPTLIDDATLAIQQAVIDQVDSDHSKAAYRQGTDLFLFWLVGRQIPLAAITRATILEYRTYLSQCYPSKASAEQRLAIRPKRSKAFGASARTPVPISRSPVRRRVSYRYNHADWRARRGVAALVVAYGPALRGSRRVEN
jgi:hypothetical protein